MEIGDKIKKEKKDNVQPKEELLNKLKKTIASLGIAAVRNTI